MIERTVRFLNRSADIWFSWMAPMSVQIAVLVVALFIVTWLLKNSSARLKYALWMLVPLRLVVPPTLALVTGWGWWLLPEQAATTVQRAELATSATIERSSVSPSFDDTLSRTSRSLAGGAGSDANRETHYAKGFAADNSGNAGISSAVSRQGSTLRELEAIAPISVSRLSVRSYMMLIWVAITIGFLMRLGLGAIRISRTIQQSQPAPSDVVQLAILCKKQMGLSQVVDIRCSREIQSPMLVGLTRPTILLPVGIANLLSHNELRSVLVHELQHVARRDLIVNFVESVLASIYFFHPGVWLARSASRRLREEACDEGTVAVLDGHRREYGLGIVKVAELVTGQRQLSALSLLESKSQMKRRVMRILDPKLRAGRSLSWTAVFAVIALGVILIPGAARSRPAINQPGVVNESDSHTIETNAESPNVLGKQQESENETAQQPEASQDSPKSIRFKVTDLSGKPLSGAGIYLNSSTTIPKPQVENDFVICNEMGEAAPKLIPNVQGVRVWASHSGYVTLVVLWEKETFAQLPKEFCFRLQPGTQIGGVILDPQGKPISGVKVEARCSGGVKLDGSTETELGNSLAHGTGDPDPAIFTDSAGRWSLNNVPEGDEIEFSFLITHPDYLTDTRFRTVVEYETTVDELRQQTAKFKLKEGVRAKGTVVDPAGEPISGAVIIWGDHPYWEEGSQEITTDDEGRFNLPAQSSGKRNVTVVAKGWMPEIRNVDFQSDMQPIDFQLKPGKKLHLKFVDSDGKPVPNVYVQIRTWHDVESLYSTRHPNVVDTQIPSKANEQGEFVWDWAPDDAVKYMFGKPDTKYVAQTLVADGEIKIITIDPKTTLTGNVVDSQTGKPITNFTIVPIAFGPSGRGIAQSGELKKFSTSQFTLDERTAYDPRDFEFQFDALGYRTKRSERFSISTMPTSIVIRMDPAPIQMGRVVNKDGKPIPGIHVNLATPEFGFTMESSKYRSQDGNFFVTNDKGVFQYPAQVTSSALVVADPQGYAEKCVAIDEAPGDLVLQPWANVEGHLFQAGQPVAGARVHLRPIHLWGDGYPDVQATFQETTDANGRFAFKDVPPIPCAVSGALSSWEDFKITSSQSVPLDLQPGETRSVKLGAEGIAVSGKVKLLGEGADAIQFRYGLNYLVHLAPGLKLPTSISKANFDLKSGRIEDWLSSTEGYAFLATLDHHFVKLNPDGSFLINGVAPGDYRFLLKVYEPPTGCLIDPVGMITVDFAVDSKAVEAGSLDLGDIELNISAVPKVGDAFPNFSFQRLDGTKRRFDEHRGKYVILDFWATWCAPCVQTMPKMDELNRSLDENSNVVVLSVSLDQELATAKAFVDEQKLVWAQGFIGDVDSLAVRQMLGIGSVPLYYLVDPEGKIVLRSYDFEEFKKQLPTELTRK